MSSIFATTGREPSVPTMTGVLTWAAVTAGCAPSIHNSQPWHWQVADAGLDLHLATERRLTASDPDGRLAILSCGAALHHARVALAAEGWQVKVVTLPDPADPGHLAHVSVYDRQPANPDAVRKLAAVQARRADRRPVSSTPLTEGQLLAVTVAVAEEGVWLYDLPRDRIVALASAVSYAQRTEADDDAWQAELARWSGAGDEAGTGVPDSAIPERPTRTAVPARDFGHSGTLVVDVGHDQGASFAILYGPRDEPVDWLRAGQALSAAWLTATELGIALLPMSAAVEVPAARQVLCRLAPGTGHPYLVLRLGVAPADPAGARHTPRLPVEQTIERAPD
jgi:nitroreductase